MESQTPSQSAAGARTVLIVDDDRSVAQTFARMLELEGLHVETAQTAETGLVIAEKQRPHAIILDLRMPILNGLQFLRVLRSKPDLAATPVAIVTGDYFVDESMSAELATLGASLRFKPLWLEDLVSLTHTLLNNGQT